VSFYITKSTGQKELFSIKKFKRSLKKAGASDALIKQIVQDIESKPKMRTTKEIYEYALSFLHKTDRPLAARYNLKKALMDLGPAGYPFETFISELFRAQGYEVERERIFKGICIEHEVDVSARKNSEHYMIECKFHNRRGLKSDVKVPLYIKARFDDIQFGWKKNKKHGQKFHAAWIVTNTTFTSVALRYGTCVQMHMLDWKYPKGQALPDIINKFGLHPITALTSLNNRQKKQCIKAGFVLCKDAHKHADVLRKLKLSQHEVKNLIQESEKVCSFSKGK